MPDLNQPAPNFELLDLDGQAHRLNDYHGRVVLVNFWSAECPWSERADRELLTALKGLEEPVVLLSVASNANEPVEMLREATRVRGLPVLLVDPGARVADAFQAQTTPHAFVIDRLGILRYQGAVDDVTFRHRMATRWYVVEALRALFAGRPPEVGQAPAYGCTIVRRI